MEGTEKQVAWATEIKAAFESALNKSLKKEDLNSEQIAAIQEAVSSKDAAWWIKVSAQGRVKGDRLIAEITEYHVRGFHKIPGTKKSQTQFF